jgi:hypothetical protein
MSQTTWLDSAGSEVEGLAFSGLSQQVSIQSRSGVPQ